MLVNISFDREPNPILELIAKVNGFPAGGPTNIGKGLYLCNNWNFDNITSKKLENYPYFSKSNPEEIAEYKANLESNNGEGSRYLGALIEDMEKRPKEVYYKEGWQDYLKRKEEWESDSIGCYGVVDSPEQLLSFYDFEKDPRKFVISFVKIERKNQSPEGGWRYHKWGEYYGTQKPECEYLYNDKHIDAVYTYHIYQIVE